MGTIEEVRIAKRTGFCYGVREAIDKAKEAFDEQQAEEAANRMLEGPFTLEDFLEQMAQVKKMGNLGNLMKLMPGMPKELRNTEIDDRELARIDGSSH